MRFHLDSVWPSPSCETRSDVIDFWRQESALRDPDAATERAAQLVVVARDEEGDVAGVSTAVPVLVESLGFRCFYFRMFVGRHWRVRGLRSTGLNRRIVVESCRLLNQSFLEGNDPDVLGVYMEIENRSVLRHRRELVWSGGGMSAFYLGSTRDGRHIRVFYFDGAHLPP